MGTSKGTGMEDHPFANLILDDFTSDINSSDKFPQSEGNHVDLQKASLIATVANQRQSFLHFNLKTK